ncbi:MAG: hypothetical protein GYA17_16485, partial [Chloroflexi bacterium]|nr:hypothetical protein [Chloroflexota bacterium]
RSSRAALALGLLLWLAACGQPRPVSPTPAAASPSPAASATLRPSVPTPTGTPVPVAQAGTPLPPAGEVISPDNLSRLAPLAAWGGGIAAQAAYDPGGSWLAVATTRGLVLYDPATLQVRQVLQPGVSMRSLAFSPGGERLAAGSEGGQIFVWQVEDLRLVKTIPAGGPVFSLAFSPDASQLAAGGWDNLVRLWNLASRSSSPSRSLQGHAFSVEGLAYAPDGTRLFSWSSHEQVQVWRLSDGRQLDPLYIGIGPQRLTAVNLSFSRQGDLLAVNQGTRVRVVRTRDGIALCEVSDFDKQDVLQAVLSPDGSVLATVTATRIAFWQADDGSRLAAIDHATPAGSRLLAAFDARGERLFTAADQLALWSAGQDEPRVQVPSDFSPGYRSLAVFTPGGDGLLTTYTDGQVRRLNFEDGVQQSLVQLSGGPFEKILPLPEQGLAVASGADRDAWIYGLEDGALLATLEGHQQAVLPLDVSPAGDLLATGSADDTLRVWSLPGGELLATLDMPGNVGRVLFSPDGRQLAAIAGGQVRVWSVPGWELLAEMQGVRLAFDPSSTHLALGFSTLEGPQVALRAGVSDDRLLHSLPASGSGMAFSPDGRLLAISGARLTLWSVDSGELLLTLDPPAPQSQVLFSPDGRLLLLSAADGAVYVWGVS